MATSIHYLCSTVLAAAVLQITAVAAATVTAPIAAEKPYLVKSAHGDRNDPYYWLRDDQRTAPAVLDYLNAENQYYQQYAAKYPQLTKTLTDEIIARVKQDDSSVPAVKGDYSYYTRYESGKQYPIYARKAKQGGTEQIMLDVNTMAAGKDFYQIGNYAVSPDQQLLAYVEDLNGRRSYTVKIRDLRTGKDLPDQIKGAEASLAWSADSKQLFYVEKDPQTLLGNKIKRHTLGQAATTDQLLYQEKDNSFYIGVGNSSDDQYVVISTSSTVSSEMLVLKSDDYQGQFKSLAPRQRDFQYEADHLGDRWIIKTDWDAPNYRLMAVKDSDIGDRQRWTEVLAHDSKVFIDSFQLFTDYLVLNERSDALDRVRLLPWADLTKARYLASDEPAYVSRTDNNPEQNTDWLRYSYTSLTTPASIFELNMKTGEKRLLKQQEVLGGFDKTIIKRNGCGQPPKMAAKFRSACCIKRA